MLARRAHPIGWAIAFLAVALICSGSSVPRGAAQPPGTPVPTFTTAVFDPHEFPGPDASTAFEHARAIGAGAARILLVWSSVAPSRPAGDATDPANAAYHWGGTDRQVTLAAQARLEPLLDVVSAPDWTSVSRVFGFARGVANTSDLGQFMLAAARRYSGAFRSFFAQQGRSLRSNATVSLPRVRYWQIWNEPNHIEFISPQWDAAGRPVSPLIYRQMLAVSADSIHEVHPDNLVITGGLSPFGQPNRAMAPMQFMAALLCMSATAVPAPPACREPVKFDVWAHHPYTAGGPMHKAGGDNVSLGDLPRMKKMLDDAAAAGRIQSGGRTARGGVPFWVTEFSWDSTPPDTAAVPADLEVAWVAEALYRMWRSGVSLVTWFLVRDEPTHFQSALFFRGASVAADTKKPAAAAFVFPFVGHVVNGRLLVWGRTPSGKAGDVLISAQTDRGWVTLGRATTDSSGVFTQRFDAGTDATYVRASMIGDPRLVSPRFPLAELQDMPVNPFGSS
jgi:hypothetical protein